MSKPNKEAYVTLVMKGDNYIAGAVACAMSLKYNKCKKALVCMVTSDVSTEGRKLLSTVFDEVIEVPYLEFKSKSLKQARQEELYGSWNSCSYTKWNCLQLVKYKKVLFIDADMICLRSLDHIFELTAPAATFSTPWATNFKTKKYRKKELEELKQVDEFTLTYNATEHGDIINAKEITTAINGAGYAFIASMVLLEPNIEYYNLFKTTVKSMEPFGLNCYCTCDEQSLAYFYSTVIPKQWTYIHQRYNFIIHKPEWLRADQIPEMLHYFADKKPWQTDTLWTESVWNTDNIWWYYFHKWIMDRGITIDNLKRVIKFTDADKYKMLMKKIPIENFAFNITRLDTKYFPWISDIRLK